MSSGETEARGEKADELAASDAASDDGFGSAVSLSEGFAAIGAPGDDEGETTNAGSIYIYSANGPNWSLLTKMTASDPAKDMGLGFAVAADGPFFVAGAPSTPFPAQNSGAAYVLSYGPSRATGWALYR